MCPGKCGFILSLLFVSAVSASAQKRVVNQRQVWYAYYVTFQFNERWYWQTEVQERHFTGPAAQHQFAVRSHLHLSLGSSGWEASAGMALFRHHANNPAAVKLAVPELRPHLEIGYKQRLKQLTLDHRYRAEGRFFHNTDPGRTSLEEGYDFSNFRIRYRIQATIPIWKMDDERALKVYASDEVHINAGRRIITNVFDQNRIYAGLSLDALPGLTVDVGYLNWFQQVATGDFYNRDIIRFTVLHKLGR